MPFAIQARPEIRLVVVTFQGTVTALEIFDALQHIPLTEGWKPSFDTFWDCRQIDQLDFEPAYLERVAEAGKSVSSRLGQGRGAIVAPRELDRDIAQLLILKMQDGLRDRRLFPTVDRAARWLGVDTEDIVGGN